MPLIPQQDIVSVTDIGPGEPINERLKKLLEDYPPVRILSLTETVLMGTRKLTAVIEAV